MQRTFSLRGFWPVICAIFRRLSGIQLSIQNKFFMFRLMKPTRAVKIIHKNPVVLNLTTAATTFTNGGTQFLDTWQKGVFSIKISFIFSSTNNKYFNIWMFKQHTNKHQFFKCADRIFIKHNEIFDYCERINY